MSILQSKICGISFVISVARCVGACVTQENRGIPRLLSAGRVGAESGTGKSANFCLRSSHYLTGQYRLSYWQAMTKQQLSGKAALLDTVIKFCMRRMFSAIRTKVYKLPISRNAAEAVLVPEHVVCAPLCSSIKCTFLGRDSEGQHLRVSGVEKQHVCLSGLGRQQLCTASWEGGMCLGRPWAVTCIWCSDASQTAAPLFFR